ncbi:MAG: CBS domain-containing protein [Candidatus Desulfofervidaceae bacterium]|nr:CBS domain-containing protein [Candidatus Desulfofervidaceae bacterium]
MLKKKISGLPVIDEDDNLVGIITETDIFKALVSMSGVYLGGVQFAFDLPDKAGP